MKNLILIVLLSFVALSCSKDASEPKEEITDTHIKNDIPPELLGKWKEVAKIIYQDGSDQEWRPSDSGQDYDWYFKEYSDCCENLSTGGQKCDYHTYSASKITETPFPLYELFITLCGENENKNTPYKNYFRFLKGNELIISSSGIDTGEDTKYVKVE